MVAELVLAGAITCRVAYSDPIRRVRVMHEGRASCFSDAPSFASTNRINNATENGPGLFYESQGASLKPWILSKGDAMVVAQVLDQNNPMGKPTYAIQDLPVADPFVVIKHRR